MTDQREKPNDALLYYRLAAERLVSDAEKDGVIITVERVPYEPLAMRNHVAHVEVREKR